MANGAPFNQIDTANSVLTALGIDANDANRETLLNHGGSQLSDDQLKALQKGIQNSGGDPTKIFQTFIDVGGGNTGSDNGLASDLHNMIGDSAPPNLIKLKEASSAFSSMHFWGTRPDNAAGYFAEHSSQINSKLSANDAGMQADTKKLAAVFGGTAQDQATLAGMLGSGLKGNQVQDMVSQLGSYKSDGTPNFAQNYGGMEGGFSMPQLESVSDPNKSMLAAGTLSGWIDGTKILTPGQKNAIQDMVDKAHIDGVTTPDQLKQKIIAARAAGPAADAGVNGGGANPNTVIPAAQADDIQANFASGSAKLSADEETKLRKAFEARFSDAEKKGIHTLKASFLGSADNTGSAALNQRLEADRVNAELAIAKDVASHHHIDLKPATPSIVDTTKLAAGKNDQARFARASFAAP